jgi:hypothetical protein
VLSSLTGYLDLWLQAVLLIGALLKDGRPEPEELQEIWSLYWDCWIYESNASCEAISRALRAIPQAFQKWLSVRVKDSRHESVLLLATSSIHKLRTGFDQNYQRTSLQNTQRSLEAFGLISVLADEKMQSMKRPKNPSENLNRIT